MKIKNVSVNNRKKSIDIETAKGLFSLPFSRLKLKPTKKNPIAEIFVDKELANHGITYRLATGKEDSIHEDAFLDYNRDPDYLREVILHELSVEANKLIKSVGLSKHEIIRRLSTSPSQLYRLLDTANTRKSVDEMLRLFAVLGSTVELNVVREVA